MIYIFLLCVFVALILICLRVLWMTRRTPPRSSVYLPSTMQVDDECGYVLKPNLNVVIPFGALGQQFQHCTNSLGCRVSSKCSSENISPELFVAGDSQTFGFGINYHETYAGQLENQLGKKVLNLGVAGYNLISTFRLVKRFLWLRPKVVVVGYYYDWSNRNVSRCNPGSSFNCVSVPYVSVFGKKTLPTIRNSKNNVRSFDVTSNYFSYICGQGKKQAFLRDVYWTVRRLYGNFCLKNNWLSRWKYFPTPDESQLVTDFLFNIFYGMLKSKGIHLMVVYIPNYFCEKIESAPDDLVDALKKNKISLIDMTEDFQRALERGIDIKVKNDGHLNEIGHKMIAARISEVYRELFEDSFSPSKVME